MYLARKERPSYTTTTENAFVSFEILFDIREFLT